MRAESNKWRFIALVLLMATAFVHADEDPLNDPDVQKTLRAMADASTWYHPDLFGEFAGMRRYAHHDFRGAIKYYEIGAYYADKMSQLCLGLMYLNGEGVNKDPVQAYAWLDLAAERDYPDFVATRDRVKAALTPDQLAGALTLRKTLGERYADAVAKPRMAQQLRLGMQQMTGSHTGFDAGLDQVQLMGAHCGNAIAVGGSPMPATGCASGATYAKERWQPDLYFASRDRQFKATVSVGSLQSSGQPATAAPPANVPVDKP